MAFVITEAAAREIRSRLDSSGCAQPVASLLDSSGSLPVPPEILDAISRNADESEMRSIAMDEYRELEGKLDFHLDVDVYEAGDCPPEVLVEIAGLQFAMPSEMREYFTNYVLDYAENVFLLKHGRGIFRRLMDLGKGEDSAV
jgi:hypothetical protein